MVEHSIDTPITRLSSEQTSEALKVLEGAPRKIQEYTRQVDQAAGDRKKLVVLLAELSQYQASITETIAQVQISLLSRKPEETAIIRAAEDLLRPANENGLVQLIARAQREMNVEQGLSDDEQLSQLGTAVLRIRELPPLDEAGLPPEVVQRLKLFDEVMPILVDLVVGTRASADLVRQGISAEPALSAAPTAGPDRKVISIDLPNIPQIPQLERIEDVVNKGGEILTMGRELLLKVNELFRTWGAGIPLPKFITERKGFSFGKSKSAEAPAAAAAPSSAPVTEPRSVSEPATAAASTARSSEPTSSWEPVPKSADSAAAAKPESSGGDALQKARNEAGAMLAETFEQFKADAENWEKYPKPENYEKELTRALKQFASLLNNENAATVEAVLNAFKNSSTLLKERMTLLIIAATQDKNTEAQKILRTIRGIK